MEQDTRLARVEQDLEYLELARSHYYGGSCSHDDNNDNDDDDDDG